MTRPSLTRLVGLAGASLPLLVVLLTTGGAQAAAQAAAPTAGAVAPAGDVDDDPVSRLGSCLEGTDESGQTPQGDVLLVFDTSASLSSGGGDGQGSDPQGERVEAAKYLVRQLAEYVETAQVKIDVATAGFADDFEAPSSWTALDPTSADTVTSDVERYRTQDDGFETDYWLAVSGARETLEARNAGGGLPHCQAWVWFSDGQLDLDYRHDEDEVASYGETKPYGPGDLELTSADAAQRLESVAADELCRPQGVADGLRRTGIITLAVGLATGDSDDDEFALMRGIATGTDGCGREPKQVPGVFVLASSVADLYLAFDELIDPSTTPSQSVTEVCADDACEEGTRTFVLDDSIDRLSLLAASDASGYRVLLDPPGAAEPVVLPHGRDRGRIELEGAVGSVGWINDDVVRLELTKRPGEVPGWRGVWSVVFVAADDASAGKTAGSNLRLYGNLVPSIEDDGDPVAGETAEVEIGIRRTSDDVSVDPAQLGDVALDLALVYPDGTRIDSAPLTADDLSAPVPLDLSGASPGPAVIRLSLAITTRSVPGQPGTQLEPRSVNVPIELAAPPAYPVVATTEIDFGSTDETGTREAVVEVEDKGCVWLAADSLDVVSLPEGVDGAPITSPASTADSCVTGDLTVAIELDQVGAGLASGTFQVMTRPDGGAESEPIAVTVPYRLEVERPRDVEQFVWLLVLVTAGGILIPIGLLYVVKWRTAQLAGRSLTIVSVSGDVGPDSSFLLGTQPREQDGRTIALDGNRRSVALTGRAELRARVGAALTEPGHAVVLGPVSASSAAPATTRKGIAARLPLAAQDSWVVLVDPSAPAGPVEVLFLLSPTGGQLANLLVDARSRVPETVARLRASLGAVPAPARGDGGGPDDPGPGGPGGPGGWGGGWGGPDGSPTSPVPGAPAAGGGDSWGGGWDTSPTPPSARPHGSSPDGW